MKILLDTNFITLPEKFNIDIFTKIKEIVSNAEIITISQVVDELKSLGTQESKVGLQLLQHENIKIIDKKGSADDLLIETALKESAFIATNDKELKQRAFEKGIKVIFMRKKKELELSGGEMLV